MAEGIGNKNYDRESRERKLALLAHDQNVVSNTETLDRQTIMIWPPDLQSFIINKTAHRALLLKTEKVPDALRNYVPC